MKALDVAFKDLRQAFRSMAFLVFGLALPLLTSGLFYFAFGGSASEGKVELPVTQVVVVNRDEGQGGFSAGQLLVDTLQSSLPDVLIVTEAPDAAAARAAVDRQEAAVAVIIPPGLTASLFSQQQATVEVYQDPTLTLGPNIVKGLISQVVDGLAGSQIAVMAASEQLGERGVTVDASLLAEITQRYADWSRRLGDQYQREENPILEVRSPGDGGETDGDQLARMIGSITAGMMVFYVFFTGAASAQSILREEENGTLSRLFTTPTRPSTILGGKFISTFLILTVQVTVLLVATALLFGIPWGKPLSVVLVAGGLIIVAAGFGIFFISLLRNTRQAGVALGGVLTVLGMVGMAGIFAGSAPGTGDAANTLSLFTPQGWGVRGWQLLLSGDGSLTGDILLTVVITSALGVAFFAVGVFRFRKRFAR